MSLHKIYHIKGRLARTFEMAILQKTFFKSILLHINAIQKSEGLYENDSTSNDASSHQFLRESG